MYWVLAAAIGMGHLVLYSKPPQFWWWLLLAFVCVCLGLRRFASTGPLTHLLGFKSALLFCSQLMVVFSLFAGFGSWRLEALVAAQLPVTMDKTTVAVTFNIETLQSLSPLRAQLTVVVVGDGKVAEGKVDHSVYSLVGKRVRLAWYSPPELKEGQRWQGELVLRRPRGMINPNGFDYGAWLLGQGFQATGYVASSSAPILSTSKPPSYLHRLRSHLKRSMLEIESEPAHRFFTALLIGDRQALTQDDWQVLQATGTVHLMAISGLHVGLVAALGFALASAVVRLMLGLGWVSSVKLYRFCPPLLAIFLSSGYSLLAGFSVPTQRALIAVVLINTLWAIGLRCSRWALMAIALLLVSVGETMAWLQSGFWLSFAAVAFLLAKYDGVTGSPALSSRWQRLGHYGVTAIKVQCLLSIGLCVPLWLLGFPASVLSPFANLLAVPLVALFFVPALLLWIPFSFTPIGSVFLAALAWAFNGLWQGLVAMAALPHSVLWPSAQLHGGGIVLATLACVMILLPASMGLRLAACCLVVMLALGLQPNRGAFELVALDVGQGLAVAIHQPEGTFLYDTGAAFSERFNAGSHIIAPYLRSRGAMPLSIMVSHADADHSGGASALFSQFQAADVWYGEHFSALPASANRCFAGQRWLQGHASFTVLWPPKPLPLSSAYGASPEAPKRTLHRHSSNNQSCVLLVEYQGKRFLLPGDIDSSVEHALLERNLVDNIDVLVAPHHGSKTSSSEGFLAALKPKHIIVSAGYKSRYGHPHQSVLDRYKSLGAKVWHTGEQGAITVTLVGSNIVISGERLKRPKMWY